uniref:NADH-ubiquinone oxidoreductase chain 4L n=1 Tax=Stereophaedusa japonica oostoma TaxID=1885804 RepID=A0A347Z6C1_9EUPU|nr:NADH dehydrogenase subunit 4L [Stereophaedusa japonica oostoma]
MMFFNSYLFLLMVFLYFILFNTKGHLLRALIILEALMLNALIIALFSLSSLHYEPFLFLLLLTFAVVEAGMGLSLLLTYMKVSGSDMIKNNVV